MFYLFCVALSMFASFKSPLMDLLRILPVSIISQHAYYASFQSLSFHLFHVTLSMYASFKSPQLTSFKSPRMEILRIPPVSIISQHAYYASFQSLLCHLFRVALSMYASFKSPLIYYFITCILRILPVSIFSYSS
jgi:hypothetical protein